MDNPLDRYCSPEMAAVWSNAEKHTLQRKIWATVLHHQVKAGLTFGLGPAQLEATVNAYDTLVEVHPGNAREIAFLEQQTGHDIKAAIDVYNGGVKIWLRPPHNSPQFMPQLIHHGMTSHDIADNVTQALIRQAAQVTAGTAHELARKIYTHASGLEDLRVVARTHNRPAQAINLAARFDVWASEIRGRVADLADILNRYRLRGIKGAVGDSQDMLRVLGGDRAALFAMEIDLANQLGFGGSDEEDQPLLCGYDSTGQVYPRSADLAVATALLGLVAPCTSLAVTTRLMAGHGQVLEQPTEQQTGSTAMAHKVNPILAERIHSLAIAARGYHAMIVETAGEQWYEGDVSTSAVRRVAWPGLCVTVDAVLRATLELVDRLRLHKDLLAEELDNYAPQLATGAILHALVKAGMAREDAHDLIRRYAHDGKTWRDMAFDPKCPLSWTDVGQVIDNYMSGRL